MSANGTSEKCREGRAKSAVEGIADYNCSI